MISIKNFFKTSLDFFITPDINKHHLANLTWLAVLFFSGIAAWSSFLYCSGSNCGFHDWSEIVFARLSFLKDAAEKGLLPLHPADYLKLGDFYTFRYLAIPDAFISPQFYLLRFMEIKQFVFFQIVLMYALGFGGLVWLRRKLNLSILAFSLVFVLFNFNGHILAHLSIGHLTWAVYFLFPWFVVQMYRLMDNQGNWRWLAETSFLLFFMLLQGGYHQFVWILFFLGLFALCSPKYLFTIFKTGLFSVLLGMVHFLPLFSILSTIGENKFIAGYPDFISILQYMTTIKVGSGIDESFGGATKLVGAWEITFYTGFIGALFISYFGLIQPVLFRKQNSPYLLLILPSLALIILSLNKVYQFLLLIFPLPPITGERVVTRLVGLAFVFILFQAAVEFQKYLNAFSNSKMVILITGILSIICLKELSTNFLLWDVQYSSIRFVSDGVYVSRWFVANDYNDTLYIRLIIIGTIITLLTAAFLITMLIRENRQSKKQPTAGMQS